MQFEEGRAWHCMKSEASSFVFFRTRRVSSCNLGYTTENYGFNSFEVIWVVLLGLICTDSSNSVTRVPFAVHVDPEAMLRFMTPEDPYNQRPK